VVVVQWYLHLNEYKDKICNNNKLKMYQGHLRFQAPPVISLGVFPIPPIPPNNILCIIGLVVLHQILRKKP
jgi:hypothetical protein